MYHGKLPSMKNISETLLCVKMPQ